jgi:excisionase family DNA binding protein
MIIFKSPEALVSFIDPKLPPKIKEELYFDRYTFEHKGKEREGKITEKPITIVTKLRSKGFVLGMTDNPNRFHFPETYILLWTKLLKHLEQNDTLTFEQEKYRLISINKACEMLEVTRPTIYKLINEKKIPFVEVLSQRRIQLKDLLDFIDNNKKYK